MSKKEDKARKDLAKNNGDLYRDKVKYPNQELNLCLKIPMSINHMYYNTKGGGKRLTSIAEKYIRESRAYINKVIRDKKWKRDNDAVWYYLDIIVYMPDRRTRDSHNMLKLLLDMMEKVTYDNDYYVMPRIQGVEYDVENPRLIATLKPQKDKERKQALKKMEVCNERI